MFFLFFVFTHEWGSVHVLLPMIFTSVIDTSFHVFDFLLLTFSVELKDFKTGNDSGLRSEFRETHFFLLSATLGALT